MGSLSKETIKKITLLYLISKFTKDGAYTSYRVQKILYFGLKNSDCHPFLFRHTQNGQYSRDARSQLDSLVELGLISMTGLPIKEDSGARWKADPEVRELRLDEIIATFSPSLKSSIDQIVAQYGYIKSQDLVKVAHEDELLQKTPFGQVLLSENIPEKIEIDLPEEQCSDLELIFNVNFINCIDHITEAIETADFNLGEVEVVGSFL